jgi:hypothetical protein
MMFGLMGYQLVAAYPGYLSFDSAYQWWQARGGEVTSLWPPGTVYLLRFFEAIWIGPHAVFTIQIVGYWICAIASVSMIQRRSTALVAALALAFMPIAWICIPHIWSDVQLAIALMAVVVALLLADRVQGQHARYSFRNLLLVFALLGLVFATLFRHNAIVAIAPLALWWVVCAMNGNASGQRVKRSVAAAGTLALLASALIVYAIAMRVTPQLRADTYAITLIWDLQAISVARGQNLIPKEISPNTSTDDLRASFSPLHAVNLYAHTKAEWANAAQGLTAEQKRVLHRAWWHAIVGNPGAYAWHRARVTYRIIGRKHDSTIYGGSDERIRMSFKDNPTYALANPNWLQPWHTWSDFLKRQYWATPLAWVLIASGCLAAMLIRSRRRAERQLGDPMDVEIGPQRIPHSRFAPICLWSSGVLYLASFMLTTPAADLRYALWTVIAITLAAIVASDERG